MDFQGSECFFVYLFVFLKSGVVDQVSLVKCDLDCVGFLAYNSLAQPNFDTCFLGSTNGGEN